MANQDRNTHKYGAISSFTNDMNLQENKINKSFHHTMCNIYDNMIQLNNTLNHIPPFIQSAKLYATNNKNGIQYKKPIEISKSDLYKLLLTVTFVAFMCSQDAAICCFKPIALLCNRDLHLPTSAEKQSIKCRKQLKFIINIKFLTSNQLKRIERLIVMYYHLQYSSGYSIYSQMQTFVIVAFVYVKALMYAQSQYQRNTNQNNIAIQFRNVINNNPKIKLNSNSKTSTNKSNISIQLSQYVLQFPDSSLDIVLKKFPGDEGEKLIINVLKEMKVRQCKFLTSDDVYNLSVFDSVLGDMFD
eukprot:45483_1